MWEDVKRMVSDQHFAASWIWTAQPDIIEPSFFYLSQAFLKFFYSFYVLSVCVICKYKYFCHDLFYLMFFLSVKMGTGILSSKSHGIMNSQHKALISNYLKIVALVCCTLFIEVFWHRIYLYICNWTSSSAVQCWVN